MSETDDTDELLLIPPDLFVIDSDFEKPYVTAPYYNIVDTLITQVNHLEDRINYIAIASDTSLINDSFDEQRSSMSRERNFYSNDNLSSTQSTPQKPRSIFKLNSLPPSPTTTTTTKRFSPKKYGNGRNDNADNQSEKVKLLNEIDNFISNVKKSNKVARNLDDDYKSFAPTKRSLEVKDVNAFLDDVEACLCPNGLNSANVNMLTATSASDLIPTSGTDSLVSMDTLTTSSSDSTQVTAYHNGNPEAQARTKDFFRSKTSSPQRTANIPHRSSSWESDSTKREMEARRLLSLTDLWGQYAAEGGNLVNKLEEERLRRKVYTFSN